MHISTTHQRPGHPILRELVGNIELASASLLGREDSAKLTPMVQMFANAEYWLSFDLAAFEPLLSRCPSPLRELGVAVALKFGDVLDGSLTLEDLSRARETLQTIAPSDLFAGIEIGCASLERAVRARDAIEAFEHKGFGRHTSQPSLTVNALRAAGRSHIAIEGHSDQEKRLRVAVGSELTLTGTDERNRPLQPPEVESTLDAPLLVRDSTTPGQRTIVLLVPGEYWVRVPGRASGDRKLFAY